MSFPIPLILIKTICKKIIQNEIRMNDTVLISMLKEITAMLDAETVISVQVSSDDYKVLVHHATNYSFKLVENQDLASGDVVYLPTKVD